MVAATETQSRRVELILRQIDALPTLPAVAMRLLSLTADDQAEVNQVVQMIQADPALTAKVLGLCRRGDASLHDSVLTVERAVLQLGFTAVRNAVLSVKVLEMFPESSDRGPMTRFRAACQMLDAERSESGISNPVSDSVVDPSQVSREELLGLQSDQLDGLDSQQTRPAHIGTDQAHMGQARMDAPSQSGAPHQSDHASRFEHAPNAQADHDKSGHTASPPGSSSPGMTQAQSATSASAKFDRVAFWTHSIAVACASEMLARKLPEPGPDIRPDEAFVCGLLHDMGKLALHHLLPKSFDRVIELADLNQANIAEFERRIIGIDHHTAGKRLAEQWQLPHRLQDCLWLHGWAYPMLPSLTHRRLIGVVSLADLIVRHQHLGFSGNAWRRDDPIKAAAHLGLTEQDVTQVIVSLHEKVQAHVKLLSLDQPASTELFFQSIQQANDALGKLNAALDRRSRTAGSQQQVLEAITQFHQTVNCGATAQDVTAQIVRSASTVLGQGFYAVLVQARPGEAWLISQFSHTGELIREQLLQSPHESMDLTQFDATQPGAMGMTSIMPWVADSLQDCADVRRVRLLPLMQGSGATAVLLHDRSNLPPWAILAPLAGTWGAAIASATQHDGARRVSEELAQTHYALAEAQDRLLQQESLARLGEMACGAAHEMNNPLAVISGRSQLLATSLDEGTREKKAAQTIVEQSQRLSDLITSLRLFTDPPQPDRQPSDLPKLVDQTIKQLRGALPSKQAKIPIHVTIQGQLPNLLLDSELISQALKELLLNAVQSKPKSGVSVTLAVAPEQRQLALLVADDGGGMDQHTLEHAMDPFFSAKEAGRQVGMGLARAKQITTAHGGSIRLRSTLDVGTVVTLTLPLDSVA